MKHWQFYIDVVCTCASVVPGAVTHGSDTDHSVKCFAVNNLKLNCTNIMATVLHTRALCLLRFVIMIPLHFLIFEKLQIYKLTVILGAITNSYKSGQPWQKSYCGFREHFNLNIRTLIVMLNNLNFMLINERANCVENGFQ